MKHILNVQCLLAAFALLVMGASCPKQRVAYETLSANKLAAETAVKEAAIAYSADLITLEDWLKVKDIYDNKWQPAHNAAVELARQDYTAPAPELTQRFLLELTTLVSQLLK